MTTIITKNAMPGALPQKIGDDFLVTNPHSYQAQVSASDGTPIVPRMSGRQV
jgi:hypothetical protein